MSGILKWALDGAKQWLESGLEIPEIVRSSTQDYRADMDEIGQFLLDCCEKDTGSSQLTSKLYGAYKPWAEERNMKPVSQKAFALMLDEHGIQRDRKAQGVLRVGMKLREGV